MLFFFHDENSPSLQIFEPRLMQSLILVVKLNVMEKYLSCISWESCQIWTTKVFSAKPC